MSTNEQIIDRIKKLLSLATSSEAHEAALALEMAQRLLEEHHLTTDDVEAGVIVTDGLTSVATYARTKHWELMLYRGISDAFGCGLMFSPGRSGHTTKGPLGRKLARYLFIGSKTDVQLAVYAAHVLQRKLVSSRDAFTKALGPEHQARTVKSGEVDSYCLGWVRVALTKVQKLVPHPARALAIAKHIEDRSGGNVKISGRLGSDEAEVAGMSDAGDLNLDRPMGGTSTRSLNTPRKVLGGGG